MRSAFTAHATAAAPASASARARPRRASASGAPSATITASPAIVTRAPAACFGVIGSPRKTRASAPAMRG